MTFPGKILISKCFENLTYLTLMLYFLPIFIDKQEEITIEGG